MDNLEFASRIICEAISAIVLLIVVGLLALHWGKHFI